jgi:hypothetical protein
VFCCYGDGSSAPHCVKTEQQQKHGTSAHRAVRCRSVRREFGASKSSSRVKACCQALSLGWLTESEIESERAEREGAEGDGDAGNDDVAETMKRQEQRACRADEPRRRARQQRRKLEEGHVRERRRGRSCTPCSGGGLVSSRDRSNGNDNKGSCDRGSGQQGQ